VQRQTRRCTDGWTNGQMDERTDGITSVGHEQTDAHVGGRRNGQVDGRMDGQTLGQVGV